MMLAASPTDAERTLTAFAWRTLTRPGCPSPSWIAGRSREDFFLCSDSEKRPARECFLCFNAPLWSSQNQVVLAAGLKGTGTRARDFQHYVRSQWIPHAVCLFGLMWDAGTQRPVNSKQGGGGEGGDP